jgi:1-deoxy-D-xylulose-5-phosphate synthase
VSDTFQNIQSPEQLKQIRETDLKNYAQWLRRFLIDEITLHGGHFAANLGVVELTIALHYVFNAPKDIFIWDVGHQSYAHKILTHRKSNFNTLRKLNGISGFPKMSESDFDAFGTAHSSTSISAALGYAVAAKLQNLQRQHIAIIGDGALSAGQAFEALNNAGVSQTNITIIINDNHIGIDPSQGALGEYLDQLSNKPENFFTDLGFQYFGPIDGHDIHALNELFDKIININSPKIIHVKTIKGFGHAEAEAEQTKWHSVSKFDKLAGKDINTNNKNAKFQDIFGRTLLKLAENNPKIVAVTPAMISGSSLHFFQEKFPERVFDVGIAEQHAITFSAGLAAAGMIPVCCLYATFLQRGYDQLIHDVALQNLPVIFAIDRAGLVGEDGPTHHGVFDVAFLQTIPNIKIISPSNQNDLKNALYTTTQKLDGPVVIRYPRGQSSEPFSNLPFESFEIGKAKCIKKGKNIAVISYGNMTNICLKSIKNTNVSLYDLRTIKPLDTALISDIFNQYQHVLMVEEVQKLAGIGSSIAMLASEFGFKGSLKILAIEDHFVTHGSPTELLELENLSENCIETEVQRLENTILK